MIKSIQNSTKGKLFSLAIAALFVGVQMPLGIFAGTVSARSQAAERSNTNNNKVTLCHATSSDTNPYVKITVAAASAYNGHYKSHDADIIPSFEYKGNTYSKNWDTENREIFENGCKDIVVTEMPEPVVRSEKPNSTNSRGRSAIKNRPMTTGVDHCYDHQRNKKIESKSGTYTLNGVTAEWSGDPGMLQVKNSNDTIATITWCAKGGKNFAKDGSMSVGKTVTTLNPNEEAKVRFGTEVSYFIVYSVETDPDDPVVPVVPTEPDEDDETDPTTGETLSTSTDVPSPGAKGELAKTGEGSMLQTIAIGATLLGATVALTVATRRSFEQIA
jgi:hypothetical protein